MAPDYIKALDEFFCAKYSDYTAISAIEGYKMPELIQIGKDGNISRREPELMRLCRQENAAELLARFKSSLHDLEFTFHFSFRPFGDKIKDPFRKYTFKKVLPAILARAGETAESAGEKLALEPKIWRGIVKGRLYPEKNTVLALALSCRLSLQDTNTLLAVCGFALSDGCVRDIVAEYLITQKIFNKEMRDSCLREYRIDTLPLCD